jgi:hypothetical protein
VREDSLLLILCRVWQGTFVLEHLAEITTVDPAATGGAADEMLGIARRRVAETRPDVFAAKYFGHFCVTGSTVSWPGGKQ